MTTVPFGWLLRSIHSWSANLMIFFAFVHLATRLLPEGLPPPAGAHLDHRLRSLLFLALAFGFSGYLLPWNQLSFFATRVGTDIAGVVPGIGAWIAAFPARRRPRHREAPCRASTVGTSRSCRR